MVEQTLNYDIIFGSLADPTRRDILRRLMGTQMSISQIAAGYNLTFGAISKHLLVLERAKLIIKSRRGREHIVRPNPATFKTVAEYINHYEPIWNARFDALESSLMPD